MTPLSSAAPATLLRARELLDQHLQRVWRRTDRMFVGLMLFEWIFGIGLALVYSPRTWAGAVSTVHPHVWAAVFFGAAITSLPVLMALRFPGQALTRHAVAVGQMLMSALFIHLMDGRIEAHFQISDRWLFSRFIATGASS